MKSQPIAIPVCVLIILVAAAALPAALNPETPLEKKIQFLTDKLTPALTAIRQDIHCHPELGFQLPRTSAIVAEYFRKLGLEVRTGFAEAGALGFLQGGKPGRV